VIFAVNLSSYSVGIMSIKFKRHSAKPIFNRYLGTFDIMYAQISGFPASEYICW